MTNGSPREETYRGSGGGRRRSRLRDVGLRRFNVYRQALPEKFSDFIERYGMTDMYSAGFYPFPQEEKWAYWSRHIYCNRYDVPAGKPIWICISW